MKRVVFIFPKLSSLGGAEKVFLHAMKIMQNQGYEIILITQSIPDNDMAIKLYGIDIEKIVSRYYKVRASNLSSSFRGIWVYQKEKEIGKILEIIEKEKPEMLFISQANMPKIEVDIPKIAFVWCPFTRYLFKRKNYKLKSEWRKKMDAKVDEAPDDYLLLANSEWTQDKIKQIWGCESKVLYPCCDIKEGSVKAEDKKNWICTISRFNKHKHIEIAIDAVKELENLELHLIGIAKNEEDEDYLKKLKKMAGSKCVFHVNASIEEKKEVLKKSKYGLHLNGANMQFPTYVGYEHFGIVIAEMMSFGCVMQHYKYGFFPEFILDEDQKFNGVDDIITNIKKFEDDFELYNKTMLKNQEIASKYTDEEFEKGLLEIVEKIGT